MFLRKFFFKKIHVFDLQLEVFPAFNEGVRYKEERTYYDQHINTIIPNK